MDKDRILNLPSLVETDTHAIVDHFRAHFEISPFVPWIRQAHQMTHGWPAHINHYLKAYAAQLLQDACDPSRVRPECVRQAAIAMRRTFHQSRMDPNIMENIQFCASVIKSIPSAGGKPGSIRRHVDRMLLETPEHDRPERTAHQVIRRLESRGILSETPDRERLYCPIPSLRDHMIAAIAREPGGRAP